MHSLLSIDPGWATGISLWRVPDDEPIERLTYWLIAGGIEAFSFWFENVFLGDNRFDREDILVCEEFIQDGRTPKVDTNALLIQGYLMGAWGIDDVVWQPNVMKNAKTGDALLKQHGLWLTGKQVGWKDGRDVMDSQLHALAWAKNNHAPSQEFFFPKG